MAVILEDEVKSPNKEKRLKLDVGGGEGFGWMVKSFARTGDTSSICAGNGNRTDQRREVCEREIFELGEGAVLLRRMLWDVVAAELVKLRGALCDRRGLADTGRGVIIQSLGMIGME